LRNSAAAGALGMQMLRGAILAAEQDSFYTGSGVGKPMGIIGHPSCVSIARATANAIGYADLLKMYAQFMGSPVWIASRSTLPQLMSMVATGTNYLVWQPNAIAGAPASLLGIPLLIHDQSPVLGQEGDLALVDLKYYAIKDGSPLAIFIDPYTQKVNGITRMYAFWNVDGQPMITSPLLGRDGVTQVSPFVVLK
jgi:HK97 family phage major capsid protein